jgi:hypothetical protein
MSTAEENIVIPPAGAVSRGSGDSLLTRFMRFACSVRLGVTLLCLLGLACLVGMLIMQQNVEGFEKLLRHPDTGSAPALRPARSFRHLSRLVFQRPALRSFAQYHPRLYRSLSQDVEVRVETAANGSSALAHRSSPLGAF